MERKKPIFDRHLFELVRQVEVILSQPEEVYDLVGKRLALVCTQLAPSFSSESFRLGIVGNPNRGKTTLAYSYFRALETYDFPASYFDLDIYSNSGRAIFGDIKWIERLKRQDVSQKEIEDSILAFGGAGPGVVIGDFPGRIDNPYQLDRLKGTDLVMILGSNNLDRRSWQELAEKSGVPALWLHSQLETTPIYPIDPSIFALKREPKPRDLDVLTSLTRVLEVIAEIKGISLLSPWKYFSEAEKVILEEVLDFKFAPFK